MGQAYNSLNYTNLPFSDLTLLLLTFDILFFVSSVSIHLCAREQVLPFIRLDWFCFHSSGAFQPSPFLLPIKSGLGLPFSASDIFFRDSSVIITGSPGRSILYLFVVLS